MNKLMILIAMLVLTGCGSEALTGKPGPVGPRGEKGDAGESVVGPQGGVGPAGVNGTNGVDANPVTFVKLCNDTPSYPTVFVEYGICLQGKLYAVYSSNGGFLALLPNGNYNSNAIGSSCNLTVNGCTVTH